VWMWMGRRHRLSNSSGERGVTFAVMPRSPLDVALAMGDHASSTSLLEADITHCFWWRLAIGCRGEVSKLGVLILCLKLFHILLPHS
jgi:hypothetical protein